MNLFKALGALLLITGLIIALFMYDPDNVAGGTLTVIIDLWLPMLCILGGIGLFIKGFFWKPPKIRSASSNRSSSKKSRKKKK